MDWLKKLPMISSMVHPACLEPRTVVPKSWLIGIAAAESCVFFKAQGSQTTISNIVDARCTSLMSKASLPMSKKACSALLGSQEPPTNACVFRNTVCASVGVRYVWSKAHHSLPCGQLQNAWSKQEKTVTAEPLTECPTLQNDLITLIDETRSTNTCKHIHTSYVTHESKG